MTHLDLMLSYSQPKNLEDKYKQEVQIQQNRQEFVAGLKFGLTIYSFYCLVGQTKAAFAEDLPGSTPKPTDMNQVAPAPKQTELSEAQKGLYSGAATGICGLALQSSNFWLGVACVGLLMIGSQVMMSTPDPKP